MDKTNHPAALQYHYVLVIEFLDRNEQKTGTELVRRLSKKISLPFKFVSCYEPNDVITAIYTAKQGIPVYGYPLIHLEAHGFNAANMKRSCGIGYVDSDQKQYILMWEDLWSALRDLNVAIDFNLIVVVAACRSGDVMYGLIHQVDQLLPLPFMATVGFDDRVRSDRLLKAFTSFYRSLSATTSLEGALVAANKELVLPEILVHEWTVMHLISALKEVLHGPADERAAHYWKQHLAHNPEAVEQDKERIVNEIFSHKEPTIQMVMSRWLSYDSHPHNQTRFSFLSEMASTGVTPTDGLTGSK